MSGEYPEVYRCDTRKARKSHECSECRGTIQPGENYNYHHGIWDGPASFKVCLDCEDLRRECDVDAVHGDEKLCWIGETICESGDEDLFRKFMAIKTKRGAKLHDWMQRRLQS
jgi:hypothetical protein